MITMPRRKLSYCLAALAFLVLGACASSTPPIDLPPMVNDQRSTDLTLAILSLDNTIDPDEARRAARISIEYTQQLAREYEISGSPVVHNFLVNIGVKPRGLCIDWTADLMARLQEERFYSLELHWGIANYDAAFRLEHSAVIISARGESLYRGLVLDPWRNSGRLYWTLTRADSEYPWKPRAEIHALKREHRNVSENRQLAH